MLQLHKSVALHRHMWALVHLSQPPYITFLYPIYCAPWGARNNARMLWFGIKADLQQPIGKEQEESIGRSGGVIDKVNAAEPWRKKRNRRASSRSCRKTLGEERQERTKSACCRQESGRVRQKCKKWVTAAAKRLHGVDEGASEASFLTRVQPWPAWPSLSSSLSSLVTHSMPSPRRDKGRWQGGGRKSEFGIIRAFFLPTKVNLKWTSWFLVTGRQASVALVGPCFFWTCEDHVPPPILGVVWHPGCRM